eukprot:6179240-Prorocentrum_lima.AAC.1
MVGTYMQVLRHWRSIPIDQEAYTHESHHGQTRIDWVACPEIHGHLATTQTQWTSLSDHAIVTARACKNGGTAKHCRPFLLKQLPTEAWRDLRE